MALSDFQTADTIARSKRGTTSRNLGGTAPIVTTAAKSQLGNVGQIVDKAATVGRQALNIGEFAGKKTASFVANSAIDIGKAAYGAGKSFVDAQVQPIQNKVYSDLSKNLDSKQNDVVAAYKAGKMSKEDYTKALEDLSKGQQEISKETQKISSGPTPLQRAADVTETAINILSLRSFGLAEVGAKEAFEAGGTAALKSLVDEAATPLENVAMKIPAVKALVIRNLENAGKREAQQLAGETIDQYLVREGRSIATNLLIKRPIFYQSNIAQTKSLYDHILKGEYKGALTDAAWLGSQMVEGGPIGFFSKNASIIKGGLKKLAHGNESFIDELSKNIGDGNPSQIARFLTTLEEKTKIPQFEDGVLPVFHGTAGFMGDIKSGAITNLAEKRNLLYVTEDQGLAKWYAKDRAKGFGKVKQFGIKGQVIDGSDYDALTTIENSPGFDKLRGRTKNVLTNITHNRFGEINDEVLDNHPELAKLMADNGIAGIRVYHPNPQLTNGAKQIIVTDSKSLVKSSSYLSGKDFQEAEKTFRILQETNLRTADNNVQKAAQNLLTHYEQNGYDLANITPSQLYKDMSNWAKADELAQKTLRSGLVKGITPEDASKYVVVRWDQGTRNAIAAAFHSVGTGSVERMQLLEELASRPAAGWGNNETLMNKLRHIVVEEQTGKDIEQAIKNIDAGSLGADVHIPKKVAQQLSDLGFTIAAPVGGRVTPIVEDVNDTRKLVSAAVNGHTDIFDPVTSPQPQLASIAAAFERAGLSPQASNQAASRALSQSLVASVDSLGLGAELGLKNTQGGDMVKGGQAILSKLQTYMEEKSPSKLGNLFVGGKAGSSAITDLRQLPISDIKKALSVSDEAAKGIRQAILDGYLQVPLEIRGLGDKVNDMLYAYNPLQKYYSRIQSAMRYTYNPFFRAQERVETKILSHAQANNLIWNRSKAELDDGARILGESGIFDYTLSGEGAQDITASRLGDKTLGRITANITQGQKRDLAGLASDMAEARGMTLQQLAVEHPDDVDDALRVVVQYGKKGILASPLARTMNLAFFPMRYNAKVTQIAVQTLGKQPPAVQKAVLHGMFQMKNWLQSDEGIAWQSQNTDAIQVFNWITPVNSIEATMKLLHPSSVGDVGQLGGLPLGIVTQILDGQGVINLNRPYVNPKTGDVFPKYIPETTKARAATALGDLLNTMFTFPGRTLGLPGKTATIRNVVKSFIDTNGTDFIKQDQVDKLTPLQQNWVRVLKGDTSSDAIDSLYNSPAPGQFNGYTLPPLNLPINQTPTVTRRTNLPSKTKAGKKAKTTALPMP